MKPRLGALALGLCLWAATAQAQVKKLEIIKEVQDAFATWEKVACTGLKFEYAGELTTFVSEKDGGILVYFGHDSSTWSYETAAYHMSSHFNLTDKGDLNRASMALNARDFWWSIGQEKGKIDIQTAILHMIPDTLGFYVGSDPITGSLTAFIGYDRVNHTLDPLHETGAQFLYPKTGCTAPAQPPICGMTAPAPDGGVDAAPMPDATVADAATVDAGPPIQLCIHHSNPNDPPNGKPLHWETVPITYWIYIPDAGKIPGSTNIGGDGIKDMGTFEGIPVACVDSSQCPSGQVCSDAGICVGGGGGDDDGCCRVSHARGESLGGTLLLLLGLVVLLRRNRRSA